MARITRVEVNEEKTEARIFFGFEGGPAKSSAVITLNDDGLELFVEDRMHLDGLKTKIGSTTVKLIAVP